MLNLKNTSIALMTTALSLSCLASDFNGDWSLRSEKNAKVMFSFDKSGSFELAQYSNIKVSCDELQFSKKEMGILKRGQVSDALLVCKALDDGTPAIYSINYLNEEKNKAVFRNIEDGDDIQEIEKPLLDLIKDGSQNGSLDKFTISSDGENAVCKKIPFTKAVDSKIWNSPITYFCDIEEDPDSSAIIGLEEGLNKGEILLIQDLGDEDDLVLNKVK